MRIKTSKSLFVALAAILFTGVLFFNFTEAKLLPTKLRITVIDGLGNYVEDANVVLYGTEEDYRESINPIDSGATDKKGRVVFKDLKSVSYFIDARKGEMNNNGEGVKTQVLQEGRINTLNIVVE